MNQTFTYLTILLFITACSYTQKVKDGRTAFDRKQYSVALPMLKKEYGSSKSRIEKGRLAYMLGESYRLTNQSEKAIEWYNRAYEFSYGVDALKEYAYALKKTGKYEEAGKAFKNLGLEIGSPYEYKNEINACKIAKTWLEEAKESVYKINISAFNSPTADYAPVLYGKNEIVISSDRSSSTGELNYKWTGNKFSDFFIVNLDNNMVSSFDKNINTPYNEGSLTFNKDGTEMIFTRCGSNSENKDDFCKLYISSKSGDTWSTPEILDFIEEGINYVHPALSPDGKILYFACNHPDGWGGYDIFMTKRISGGWSEPTMMNRNINTTRDELFPSVDKDTLYFASKGHTGMGGLDIFKVYKFSNERWTPPINLKAPINSGSDDFAFVVDNRSPLKKGEVQKGYFTSSRNTGKGGDDIYHYLRKVPPPPPPIQTTPKKDTIPIVRKTTKPKPKPIVYKLILEGYVLEKIYKIANNPNSKVLGRKPLSEADVQINYGGKSMRIKTDTEGYFSLEMDEGTDYRFFASKAGYLSNDSRFSTKGIGKIKEMPIQKFTVEIVLDKIFKDQEIVLENIYYDYDKWDIREDAKPTLNNLNNILQKNPNIKIQLSSHTDCRGRDAYNETLSQKRAQSAVDYLISLGIDPVRLTAKGYGKTLPAITCVCSRCTEEEHQANRRTTFKIID